MTLKVVPFESLEKTLGALEQEALKNRNAVFRGHSDASWRIASTFSRFTTTPHRDWDTTIDELLSHFLENALSIGAVPFPLHDRRARLEYGRHHDVPTPVIDFSYSPWVALYFAFSGVQFRHEKDVKNACIYALDVQQLGLTYARNYGSKEKINELLIEFSNETPHYFDKRYPAGEMKFVPFCASWNMRMRNQLGCFLYDTIDYSWAGKKDFEDWVAHLDEPSGPNGDEKYPILTKYPIPHSEANGVFHRLYLMGLNGTRLLDHSGLAVDVRNTYNFSRRTLAWDVRLDPPIEH